MLRGGHLTVYQHVSLDRDDSELLTLLRLLREDSVAVGSHGCSMARSCWHEHKLVDVSIAMLFSRMLIPGVRIHWSNDHCIVKLNIEVCTFRAKSRGADMTPQA